MKEIKAVIFDMYETLITHYESPLYFSEEMAEDAGLPVEKFMPPWRETVHDRWTGKITLEEIITKILKDNDVYSEEVVNKIVSRRIEVKEEGFKHLHKDIIPMLEALKKKGLKTGLISNCFDEEAMVIRRSVLFPYFDFACLSFEQGYEKPDPEIYKICMGNLDVKPEECLYIGDGGSSELERARDLGMHPLQAAWYLREEIPYQSKRNPEFIQVEKPMDVLKYL